jgi:hypothetical protein
MEVFMEAPVPPVAAADEHRVRPRLGDPGGYDADAGTGDELDVDLGVGIGALEVEDELRQVLDRVDVVMGRGRDQAHAGCRKAHHGDALVHLGPGQLAALAGLGALGHLDLDLPGVC